jgi:hypothetical protein
MIPESEHQLFTHIVDEAAALAENGHVAAGFQNLRYGIERAEAFHGEGKEWAGELVCQYRDALDRYTEKYGAKLLK